MATYVITRNGVSKEIQPHFAIAESANGRNTKDASALSLDGTDRWALDDAIAMTEDGVTIFGGLLVTPVESGFGGTGASVAIAQRLSFVDYNVYPSRITVGAETARVSETLKARLTWIVGLMSAQGVSLAAAQVNGPTLVAASYGAERYLVDVLNETMALASGTGAASWTWEISYTKVLLSTEAGTVPAPFNIADGDGNVDGDITVEQPRPANYSNYVILLGGSGTRDVEDTYTGNGVTTTFVLRHSLATSYGYVTLAGVAETLGTAPAIWSYDAATNSITRTTGAPGVGAAISITYIAQFPTRVISDGGAPAASRVQRIYTEPDVFDVAVMQGLADSYRTRDMQSPKTVRFSCDYTKTGLHPGQTLTITSAKRNLSGTFLLTDVRIAHVSGSLVQRQVTAVSTTRLPSTLREKFQQTFSGTSGSSSAVASPPPSSGVTGAGAAGSLAQWTSGSALGNISAAVPNTYISQGSVTQHQAALAIAATQVTPGTVSNTEFGYLDGVTSAIQTQLDTKVPKQSTRNTAWVNFFPGNVTPAASGMIVPAADGVLADGSTATRPMTKFSTSSVGLNIGLRSGTTAGTFQTRHNPTVRARIRTGASIANIRIFIGLSGIPTLVDVDAAPNNYVGVRYSTSVPDATWVGLCNNTVAPQTVALPAIAINTNYEITIVLSGGGTLATFTINGVSATLSTNLPTITTALNYGALAKNLAAEAKDWSLGTYYMEWD
ncbi:MAG TPA: hypothetical protein VNJ04_02830 [Gemmatimonadaceae bacterium]|nr:hypothetical protein [Gemmatimonadaceae bacterium]